MAQIKTDVLERLKADEELQFAIAQGMNKKFRTVGYWLKTNDEMLASKAVVLIIKDVTGLMEDEIIEQEFKAA